jgi:D-alanyl-lipoteichoic acid acyltransferase DltB (MBOAT superfamily)
MKSFWSFLRMLGALVEFGLWSDGCIRWMQDGYNLPRGPLGVLVYLVFAIAYGRIPARHRSTYLWVTSLATALFTLGPAYTATLGCLTLLNLGVVHLFGRPRRVTAGGLILIGIYAVVLLNPQPVWLPRVEAPLYFYLHWAGIGYLFLRGYHVLIDRAKGTLGSATWSELSAYLLFAPTLRMGPLYRYQAFAEQMHRGPGAYRSLARAAGRLVTGLVRLAGMLVLMDKLPASTLFSAPETLGHVELLAHLYAAPMAIYLWISGYLDLAIGVGYALGFRVPDNFNYPWRAVSIAEFWRRWHMTLGQWIRDYVYIPLGGNRRHVFFNYTVSFFVVGLWHGTYVSYMLWGLSQGMGLAVRREWHLRLEALRERGNVWYGRLRKCYLAQSPISRGLGWLLTFHYQILTINLFLDEDHAWRLLGPRLLQLIGIDLH